MKRILSAIAVLAIVSCNTSRHMESRATTKNNENIFVNVKKVSCRIDIEKKIGRQLSVQ